MNNNPRDFTIFFDDGGVLNDNSIRGNQWAIFCGEFFSPRYGGTPEKWAEANKTVFGALEQLFYGKKGMENQDYLTVLKSVKSKWLVGMFEFVGISPPEESLHVDLYYEAVRYVNTRVRAAFPGVIEVIKDLHEKGFTLYTASGSESREIKYYLDGMGISKYFSGFYGPDLINTWKIHPDFFKNIFEDLNIKPEGTIVIEDNPVFVKNAVNTGSNVIQSCLTGEFEQIHDFYFSDLNELPSLIDQVLNSLL